MTIRPYTAADRAACMQVFRSNMPRYFTVSEEPDFGQWLDQMDGSLPTPHGDVVRYYIVEREGKVVAFGGWGIRAGAGHATLIWGGVEAAHHGRGIGRALTQFRLDEIDTLHPDLPIRIDTSQRTAVFYERFGFKVFKVTPDGYAPGLHRWDMERQSAQ